MRRPRLRCILSFTRTITVILIIPAQPFGKQPHLAGQRFDQREVVTHMVRVRGVVIRVVGEEAPGEVETRAERIGTHYVQRFPIRGHVVLHGLIGNRNIQVVRHVPAGAEANKVALLRGVSHVADANVDRPVTVADAGIDPVVIFVAFALALELNPQIQIDTAKTEGVSHDLLFTERSHVVVAEGTGTMVVPVGHRPNDVVVRVPLRADGQKPEVAALQADVAQVFREEILAAVTAQVDAHFRLGNRAERVAQFVIRAHAEPRQRVRNVRGRVAIAGRHIGQLRPKPAVEGDAGLILMLPAHGHCGQYQADAQ